MKSRITSVTVTAILGFAVAFSPVSAAHASNIGAGIGAHSASTTAAPKDAAAIAAYKAAKADYKVALDAYKAAKAERKAQRAAYKAAMEQLSPALKAFGAAKKAIGQSFSNAVKSAKATYQAVLATNPTPEVKLAAKNAFEQAKADAAATRAAALAALGTAPERPAAPAKDAKPTKPVKPAKP